MESLNAADGENKKHRTSKNKSKKDKPRYDAGDKEQNPKVFALFYHNYIVS